MDEAEHCLLDRARVLWLRCRDGSDESTHSLVLLVARYSREEWGLLRDNSARVEELGRGGDYGELGEVEAEVNVRNVV